MLNRPCLLICGKGMVEPLLHVKLKINEFLLKKSILKKLQSDEGHCAQYSANILVHQGCCLGL